MSDITRDIVYKDIDECVSNPCQNEATCNDLINEYTFPCVAGYESTNYEKDCCPRPSQCPCYKEFRRRPSAICFCKKHEGVDVPTKGGPERSCMGDFNFVLGRSYRLK